ncbi:MAG TPA: hypothetical protein VH021_23020 [Trebonia sp.]|nr:hypothetical protein [Trebonia sp.]
MLTGVNGPAQAEPADDGLGPRARPTWRDRPGWRAAAVAAGVVLLFYCAQRVAREVTVTSDGAAMMLESWAMLHGNLLLHGWSVADVSFYTTELPEYMLVELVRGLNPDVVRICAALTYTLLVVLAAAVAHGARSADKRTAVVRAGITVTVMIGPTLLAATVLLNDPDHTGTAVPILLALLVLDRARRRWWVPVLVAAVLGWSLVGDSLVLLIGVAPLVAVCGARAFGLLALRRQPLAAAWYDLSLVAAGLAAVVGGTALSALIKAEGGYLMTPSATQSTVPSTALPANAAATLNDFLGLFSADFFAARLNDWLAVTAVHLVFASLVALALFVALRAYRWDFLGGDLIAQLLAAAIVINLLAYLVLYPGSGSTTREIAPVFGLGGALAGRVLAEPLLRRRLEPLLALGAVAAVAVLLPTLLIIKPPSPATGKLARFLAAHDLTSGLAGYWNADSVTLESGGRVVIAPVKFHRGGYGLSALPWEIDTRLFDSSANDPNFLVTTAPGSPSSVTQAEAVALFGPPYRRYVYHGDTIMVWHKNLLSQLPTAPATR